MNKRWAVAGAVAAIASVGAGVTADAAPKKSTETLKCGTETVMVNVAGRNAWTADGSRWKAVSFTIVGPDFTEVKVYGGGKDLGSPDLFTCTQEFGPVLVTIAIVPA